MCVVFITYRRKSKTQFDRVPSLFFVPLYDDDVWFPGEGASILTIPFRYIVNPYANLYRHSRYIHTQYTLHNT